MKPFQFGCRHGNLKRFVVCQCEVKPKAYGVFRGRTLQSLLILLDRLLVSAGLRKDSAEVGTGLNAVRIRREASCVFADRAVQIAGLMQLYCAGKSAAAVSRLRP